jgi:UDP-N-acetylmuramyl tripeptide synthase
MPAPAPSYRTRFALDAGTVVTRLSRALGHGGAMIGGRVGLLLDPGLLSYLATDRRVALVSGTNGKTTTTAMLAAALRTAGPVASNASGANMLDGIAAALAADPACTAACEVDELYLPAAARQLRPNAIVLLNLTRDQLDRVGELRRTESAIRTVLSTLPGTVVVANADDPYVVSAALPTSRPVWVASGGSWWDDAGSCPRCGAPILHDGDDWSCSRCDLRRPDPHYWLDGDRLAARDGTRVPLGLGLPGHHNAANAAHAIAAAGALSIPLDRAVAAVRSIGEVQGRYGSVRVGDHLLRLLLAKNPAGWTETLALLEGSRRPIAISVNARQADGTDTSWLYDVPFERLAGRKVLACGDRAADVAVRLAYADVVARTAPDVLAGIAELPDGDVDVVGDYTSFRALHERLSRTGLSRDDSGG